MTTLIVNLSTSAVDIDYLQTLATNYECQIDITNYPTQVSYTGLDTWTNVTNRLIEYISAIHNIGDQSQIESQFTVI
jgi:hypothetical protein